MTQPRRAAQQPSAAVLGLGAWQLAWLAAAVFVVSAGYGALMPLLPAWLTPLMAADGKTEVTGTVDGEEKSIMSLAGDSDDGLLESAGQVADKAGNLFVVTDNDGVDDSSGETQFFAFGPLPR